MCLSLYEVETLACGMCVFWIEELPMWRKTGGKEVCLRITVCVLVCMSVCNSSCVPGVEKDCNLLSAGSCSGAADSVNSH